MTGRGRILFCTLYFYSHVSTTRTTYVSPCFWFLYSSFHLLSLVEIQSCCVARSCCTTALIFLKFCSRFVSSPHFFIIWEISRRRSMNRSGSSLSDEPLTQSIDVLRVGNEEQDERGKRRRESTPTCCATSSPKCITVCVVGNLPIDVLQNVMMFLPIRDIVCCCTLVSRSMRKHCESKCLWRQLTARCYPTLCEALEGYCRRVGHRPAHHLDPLAFNLHDCTTGSQECVLDRTIVSCLLDEGALRRHPGSVVHCVRWADAYHNLPYMTRIAVCDQRNNRIKIMRLDGTVLRLIGATAMHSPSESDFFHRPTGSTNSADDSICELSAPSGIARLTDGLLAVTEFQSHNVAIVDPDTGKLVERFSVGFAPRGIAQLPDGNLAVCLFGASHIAIYTRSGDLVKRVPVRLGGPSGITTLPDGLIAVSECYANRVAVLNPYGTTLDSIVIDVWESTGAGEGDEDLQEPRGLAYVPHEDAIAVCDSQNNRLKIVRRADGSLLRTISGPFDCLASVAVLPDGHHIVVSDCDKHRLVIMRWRDGKILSELGTGEPTTDIADFCFPRCIVILPGLV